MNRIIMIFIQVCCLFLISNATEPFYTIGKRWVLSYRNNQSKLEYISYEVVGSEIIDGTEIYKIGEVLPDGTVSVRGSGYEIDGKVYASLGYGYGYTHEDPPIYVLIFDFGAKVGDALQCNVYGELIDCFYKLIEIEDKILMGHERNVYIFDYGFLPQTIKWIEGVGCILPELDTLSAVALTTGGASFWLEECWENDECIFTYDNFFGRDKIEECQLVNDSRYNIYYDLHGRQVRNPQPGSIYIRNGKKTIYK